MYLPLYTLIFQFCFLNFLNSNSFFLLPHTLVPRFCLFQTFCSPFILFEFEFEYLNYFIQSNKEKFPKFEFFQNTLVGVPPKKYMEDIHRVQGEVHVNFDPDLSSSLEGEWRQTNKQTDTSF